MDLPKYKNVFNWDGVELLPHRPPFLFVDKLIAGDETGCIAEYTFTLEKNEFFKGHFPGAPIMPGVAQLGFAVEGARKSFAIGGALREAKKLKFLHIMEPGHDYALVLSRKGEGEIAYEFREGESLCSSGTLVF